MIRLRHNQLTLWGGYFAAEVADLWEPWMREADTVLEDEELLASVWEAQAQRHRQSRTRGRPQTPAEVVLRLFRKLNEEMGQTIVMVTHEPEDERYVDRVIRLSDGVIETGGV